MKRGRFGTAKKAALSADANNRGATEEIGGRERRERVAQLTWCGEGCYYVHADVSSFDFEKTIGDKKQDLILLVTCAS